MKPETSLIVGVVVYFAVKAANRFLGERSYGTLAPEDKRKIVDAFSQHRSIATYLPIGVMLAVLATALVNPQWLVFAFPAAVALVFVILLAIQVAVLRRLSELSLPKDYIAQFRTQSILVQIGNAIAFSLFTYGAVGRLL